MSVARRYKVVLVEPSVIVVEGLKKVFSGVPGFVVEECACDTANWLERLQVMGADIVCLNPDLLEYHKRGSVRGLFHSMPDVVLIALVYGFVDAGLLNQYHGVIGIGDDRAKIVRKLKQAVEAKVQNPEVNDGSDISDREREILVAVVKGHTNKEIADGHHISVHTVISHRKNISRKTGIKSVSGLTVYALLNGLIGQDDV